MADDHTTDAPATNLVHSDATPLETGWNRTTPDGDNIVLDAGRAMAQAYESMALAGGHRVASCHDLGLHLHDAGSASPFGNTAHLLAPLAPDGAPRLTHELTTFYGSSPGGPFLLFSPWPTGDLSSAGLAPVGHPPLMVRPASSEPSTAQRRPARADLEIRRVATPDDLIDFERTLIEGYPTRELWPYRPGCFMDARVLDTAWAFFVGYREGVPVACAASFTTDSAVLVEMVATQPGARHSGFGASLTDAAATVAADRPAVLLASDDGRNVYARLGFRPILRFSLWAGSR